MTDRARPESDAAFIERVRESIGGAARNHSSLAITGHGSKGFYGLPSQATEKLSTLDYHGIVEYDPTELVVVVRCGTPIVELESVLSASRQMLAFEPPRFAGPQGSGTVGGMIASGLSGPRRMASGAVKDFVLGMTVLDANATPLRYGGTVMKNVAGYDASRLHAGALGTLGLIADVSLKVLPLPPAESTLGFEMPEEKAIEACNTWAGQPLPISATSWHEGHLMVRLSGAQAAVRSATEKLGGEAIEPSKAQAFWKNLRDHEHEFFSLKPSDAQTALWRLAVPTTTAPIEGLGGTQWMEWGAGLRWLKTDSPARTIRTKIAKLGGHATLFRAPHDEFRKTHGVFSELSAASMKIHHRLKQELDPGRLFNPGRMYPAL